MNYRNYRNLLVVLAITLCNFASSDVLVAASNKPGHYRRSDKNRHHDDTRSVRDIIKPHCSYCDQVFTNLKRLAEHIKNCAAPTLDRAIDDMLGEFSDSGASD